MKHTQTTTVRFKSYSFRALSLLLTLLMLLLLIPAQAASADEITHHIYQQGDSRWGSYRYGSGGNTANNLKGKGCGVLSTINAVEYLTGNFIDPKIFADWAMANGEYCNGVGSYNSIAKDSVKKFGKDYCYELDEYYVFSSHVSVNSEGYPKTKSGMTTVWNHLVDKLSKGYTCVSLVKGHFIAVVDYNKSTKKVLVYDSAAGDSRGTSSSVSATKNWKTMNELWNGSTAGKAKLKLRQMYTFFKKGPNVEDAITWAVNTANDNKYGYSNKNRTGPDYDNASFISTAFNKAGFDVSGSLTTRNMIDGFEQAGFKWYNKKQVNTLKRGDILLKPGYCTELYLGNDYCVGAYYDYDGKTGDSSGKEIQVRYKTNCTLLKNKSYTVVIRHS